MKNPKMEIQKFYKDECSNFSLKTENKNSKTKKIKK